MLVENNGTVKNTINYLDDLDDQFILNYISLFPRQGKTSFDDLYSKPWSRFGPYAIGIATGYIMYRTKCRVKINKVRK